MINTTDTRSKLALFWRFSLTAISPASASLTTDYYSRATGHCSFAPRRTPHQRGSDRAQTHPRWLLPSTDTGLTKSERGPISTIVLSLFSMSPNRAIVSERSNFWGCSPVGAPGRVAGGHFRRAQRSQFAHGCAPTGERLRGDLLVERNSFRFSVPLVPSERANRSAGKKRNEFR